MMLTIGYGVLFFTAVIVSLVVALMLVRARLLPSGPVEIEINAEPERTLLVASGETLLATLASQSIVVPSACGGKGTCGTCKVRIRAGGGALLPTEAALLKPDEKRTGIRLACQVKVRQRMSIDVPPEIFTARRWCCRVRSNRNVATFIKEVVLDLPAGEQMPYRAGGYAQVECPAHQISFRDFDVGAPYRQEWDRYDLWRYTSKTDAQVQRAYSLASHPGELGVLRLNVRIALPPPEPQGLPPGQCSSYLFGLEPGDEVTAYGPFGEFFARETKNEMCLIGGGAGMAPLRSIIFDQLTRLRTDRKITFWYGARSLQEAFYVEELDHLAAQHENFEWHLALSEPLPADHWTGLTGFIHQVLHESYLQHHPAPEDVEYYLCGPPAMIAACRKMLFDLGVEAENILFDDFSA